MIKKITDLIFRIITAFLIIAAIMLYGVRLIGLTPYMIASGSMEPAYGVGNIAYIKNTDSDDYRNGDVIVFNAGNDHLVMHRIREIRIEGGKRSYITKGDANKYADAAHISNEQIKGKVVFSMPLPDFVRNIFWRYQSVLLSPTSKS